MTLPPEEPPVETWKGESVDRFVQLLMRRCPEVSGRPCIIAIDGRSAGGKSTLAALIHDAISNLAAVVHTDDLPSSRNWPRATVVHTDDIAWHHSFFDWTALLVEHVLKPTRAGQAVRYRPQSWDDWNREEGAIEVPADCSLLLLEGVGAARRELMHLLDIVVWIQSDLEKARARGIDRDGGDAEAAAFWEEWMAEEFPFLAEQKPWERADFIVNGTPELDHDPASEVVVAERVFSSR